jgi:hypothetical protein
MTAWTTRITKLCFSALFAVGVMFASAAISPAHATGTVILEGSDSIGFHCPFGQTAACDYRDQTFSAIGGASPKPIAVIGLNVVGGATSSGTHAVVNFNDLSTAGNLNDYVAIYFMAGFGCCDSNPAALAGREGDVSTYVNGGGTVEIGNYDGNSAWDFLTGGSGNGAFVAGVGGGLAGPSCTDGETVTAAGTANGFTQPGPVGCWTHQAYGQDHFAALGFVKSYFDADPAFAADNPGFGGFSSLLSNGNTVTGGGNTVPEPSVWAMMLMGFGLVGGMIRSTRRRSVALTA